MADDKQIDLSGVDDIYKTPSKESKAIDLSGLDKIYKPENANDLSDQLAAGARGAAEGVTSNFEPRIVGGLQALYHKATDPETAKLADLYNKYKQIQEQKNLDASKAYPKTYLGGQLAGGAAQLAIPGVDLAGGANAITAAGKAAALGGLSGLGATEDITANPTQTAVNVAVPAALGGAIGGIANGLTALRNAPENTALAADVQEAFNQGRKGQSLVTAKSSKDASKAMLGLGKDIQGSLDSNGNRIGQDINSAYKSAETNNLDLANPIKEKLSPIVDDLQKLKDTQTDPNRAKQVQDVIDQVNQGIENPDTEGVSADVARQLRDTLKGRSILASSPNTPDDFSSLTNKATAAAQGVGDVLNDAVPGLAPANAQYAANASAQDLLKTISPLFERQSIQNQQQIAQIISNVEGKGLKSATADELIQKLKDYADQSGNQDLQDLIENKAPDIAKRFDLTQKIQGQGLSFNPVKLLNPTTLGGANIIGNSPLAPAVSGAANAFTSPTQEAISNTLGRVLPGNLIKQGEDAKTNPPLKLPDQSSGNTERPLQLSKSLYAANSDQLKDVSNRLAQDPSLKSLSTSLNQAIDNKDEMRKNSTLFALLQNPKARQLIYPEGQETQES